MSPASFVDATVAEKYTDKFMFMEAIQYINEVRRIRMIMYLLYVEYSGSTVMSPCTRGDEKVLGLIYFQLSWKSITLPR